MKIIVCGKGGSGKSTISTLLAAAMNKKGYQVLLVDADESNYGLHRLLGVEPPTILIDHFGGKRSFKEKLNQTFPGRNTPFATKITMDELPPECLTDIDGIRLLVIGKIHDFGEGCACPIGLLSKTVLAQLEIGPKQVVIIDTEAGIEHFGRRVDAECDLVLGVVDPTYESFMLSRKIQEMAEKAGAKFLLVLNKVEDRIAEAMSKHFDPEKIVARIPKSEEVFLDSLEGRRLKTEIPEIDAICRVIEGLKQGK
jgi:CO dehydrogenase maturation factor